VRGGHGRRIGLLKLVAVERFAKGLALISGALVAANVLWHSQGWTPRTAT